MRITKIKIKNLFGIKEYEADGKNIELSGRNGVGKTSVIDAIRFALENKSDRDYIVRNGETEGEILIETDTGLSINRKSRTYMSDYKSIKQNGNPVKSPEAFLNGIITPLQLSPIEFMNMDKKKQNSIILNLISYDWDLNTIRKWFGEIPQDVNYDQNILSVLNDIQSENGYYFRTRQNINREIREKKSIISDIKSSIPEGYNGSEWESVELGELYTEIEKRRKNNEMIEKAHTVLENHDSKIRKAQADREIKISSMERDLAQTEGSYRKEISALEEQLKSYKEKLDSISNVKEEKMKLIDSEYNADVSKIEAEISSYSEYRNMDKQPVDELLENAKNVEKMKSHINEWKRMLDIEEKVHNLERQSETLTRKIDKARTLPGEILETAEIPIAGLSVKDGIPLINGLPVSNLSEGEKLDLCIDVAIQNHSGLQIVLIDGVEKLATSMRNRLYEKCKQKGVQFIATRTTDDEDLTVIEI